MTTLRRSLLFSTIDRYGVQVLTLACTMVISRILTPADFGLFAVAMSLALLIDVVREFGAGNYLVQTRDLGRDQVRAAFTVSLAISIACAAVLLLASEWLAAFYDAPGLARMIPVFALCFLLLPFGMPSQALLRREMAFDRFAAVNLSAAVVNLGTVTGLALAGVGYMSFAWAYLAGIAARTLSAFLLHPVPWAFRPSLASWRGVAGFGGWATASSIINALSEALPQLIIGRVIGLVPVGLFSRAVTLCQLPDRLVVSALAPVIFPAFADRARSGQDLRGPYLLGLTCMSAVQWPMLLCIALLADPLVLLLYGGQWTEVPPLVRILALAALPLFPAFMTYPTLVAMGRIRDTLTLTLISVPPSIAITFAASFLGIEAVAAAQFVNAPLQVAVALWFVRRAITRLP
jgi:O-antigen/teichoic acid export membrane protein